MSLINLLSLFALINFFYLTALLTALLTAFISITFCQVPGPLLLNDMDDILRDVLGLTMFLSKTHEFHKLPDCTESR